MIASKAKVVVTAMVTVTFSLVTADIAFSKWTCWQLVMKNCAAPQQCPPCDDQELVAEVVPAQVRVCTLKESGSRLCSESPMTEFNKVHCSWDYDCVVLPDVCPTNPAAHLVAREAIGSNNVRGPHTVSGGSCPNP